MANFRKISIFQAKIGYLQRFLGKLFYFSSKVTTFEHRAYFLYMIRYNNILRPVHDPLPPPATPPRPPCPKSGGHDPPTPRIDAYGITIICAATYVKNV